MVEKDDIKHVLLNRTDSYQSPELDIYIGDVRRYIMDYFKNNYNAKFEVVALSLLKDYNREKRIQHLREMLEEPKPKIYKLLKDYEEKYKERERYAQLLRDIEMKLKDPVLGIKEELRLKVEKMKTKDYIELLKSEIEELGQRIKTELQLNIGDTELMHEIEEKLNENIDMYGEFLEYLDQLREQ